MNDATTIAAIGQPRRMLRSSAEIPVIDVDALLHGNVVDQRKVADQIGTAARSVGFFYVANHGIDEELIERAYEQAAAFFSLPLDEKLKSYIAESRNHRGYVPVTERGTYVDEGSERLYEAFDSGLELPLQDVSVAGGCLMGPNVWPGVAGFRESATAYFRAASGFGARLCRAFELHLELPCGYFDEFMTRPTSQLRFLHYLDNEPPAVEDGMNMGAHTDYECFTILHQTGPGLQVLAQDGQWIDAPPKPGTFIINIGDMLEIWTNGAFRSTMHRVTNNGLERFSMPLFMAANYDAVIQPVSTMVSESNPRRYPSLVAGHHLMGQLLRDFSYLKARHDANQLQLDFDVPHGNPFELSKTAHINQAA
ncbi:MAG: isopenicillin N synthase family oxygenase [Chromatiales bacterium]|nr:isopenicillin N synthase family oxygenase [Chromatiales bacterium]